MPIWLLLGSEDLNFAPYACVENALTVEGITLVWSLVLTSFALLDKTHNTELMLLL